MTPRFETDVLIVGTGPAGASAALFLASLGVETTAVSKYGWTSPTPRAHVTNQRTVEIFRDAGIEPAVLAEAAPREAMANIVFCTSLAGEELGRVRSRGADPVSGPRRAASSPCTDLDVPQNRLEPILVGEAARRGASFRFGTEYVGLAQNEDSVDVEVRDRAAKETYTVRARYVIGADGARSAIAEDVGLPFVGEMDIAGSMNIHFRGDLARYVAHRPGGLYWLLQPGSDVGGLGMGVLRMVRPWDEWVASWGYDISKPPPEMTLEGGRELVQRFIGDPEVVLEVFDVSLWGINACHATDYRSGRVFCAGDSVHRHPPSNGLGSNTSIQDSYNLAWKLAAVLGGQAGEELLDSYGEERAPVGERIVTRANKSRLEHRRILEALGLEGAGDPAAIDAAVATLHEEGERGRERREALRLAFGRKNYEFNAHGVDLGDVYRSRAVLVESDEPPAQAEDCDLFYVPTTAPGARLPHVWLTEDGRRVSTHDITGDGGFTLLTGLAGRPWATAAEELASELGLTLRARVIGPGERFLDPYGDWAAAREVGEDGAILVRPDTIVAWRARGGADDSEADHLRSALRTILAREG